MSASQLGSLGFGAGGSDLSGGMSSLLSPLPGSFDIAAILQSAESSSLQMPDPSAVTVVARAGAFRIETVWNGRKVRGPRRATPGEAEEDKEVIEQAKASGAMDQVLAEWQVNCQVLPKGVYYHKEKKAFVATICITPSRFSSVYHGPGRNSKKYDGPSRKTAEEALADRERMAAAKDEEELLQILREIRGPHARGEKKTGHPAEVVPQGVYYKPDTGTYQAQVSVNRKNVRGPPRTSLQEAIVDRQRLLIAKANNQAEQESVELKMEYQRRISMDASAGLSVVPVASSMGGSGGGGGVAGVSLSLAMGNMHDHSKKRGRPRGSMGIGRRSVLGGGMHAGSGMPGAGGAGAFDFSHHHFPVLTDPNGATNPAFSLFLASTAAAAAANAASHPLPMNLLFPGTMNNPQFIAQFLPSDHGNGQVPVSSAALLSASTSDLLLGSMAASSLPDESPRHAKRVRKDETHTNPNLH